MKMIGTRAMQQAHRRHLVLPNGTGYYKGEYVAIDAGAGAGAKDSTGTNAGPQAGTGADVDGTHRQSAPTPHVFLIEQDPDTTILPHFHQQNQFQVIVGGGGSLGRHAVQPLLVHYAGAYTGYGPIVCGQEGIQYLTLRPRFDPGANFMPEAREQMVRGPKKHFSSEPITQLDADTLRALPSVQCEPLLPLEDGGLAVSLYRLPPHGSAPALNPATGAGQYALVTAGSMLHDGHTLQRLESIYLSTDEAPLEMRAGADGAEVLLLQFPPLAEAYRSASF